MPSSSVYGAAIEKVLGMAFPKNPAVAFSEDSLRDNLGEPNTLPLIVILDNGTKNEFDLELHPLRTTNMLFKVHAQTLAEVDAIAEVLKYDTGEPEDRRGFDFAAELPLTPKYKLLSSTPGDERRYENKARWNNAQPVFTGEFDYTIQIQRVTL